MHPVLLQTCDVPIEIEGVHHEDVTRGQLPTDRLVDALARATRGTPGGLPPTAPPAAGLIPTGRLVVAVVVGALVAMLVAGSIWWFNTEHGWSGEIDVRSPTQPFAQPSTQLSASASTRWRW